MKKVEFFIQYPKYDSKIGKKIPTALRTTGFIAPFHYGGLTYYVHKTISDGCFNGKTWAVTEMKTGLKIIDWQPTRKTACEAALTKLKEHGAKKIREIVKHSTQIHELPFSVAVQ